MDERTKNVIYAAPCPGLRPWVEKLTAATLFVCYPGAGGRRPRSDRGEYL